MGSYLGGGEVVDRVVVYTDGASRGNPGRGGYGAILQFVDSAGTEHSKELSAGYRVTTNNRMELLAAIVALEELKRPCEVSLYSDSRYLVDAFNKGWVDNWQARGWKTANRVPVKNQDLWLRLLKAQSSHRVSWRWVQGHAGNSLNERCDQLATQAADGDDLMEDEGFQTEL